MESANVLGMRWLVLHFCFWWCTCTDTITVDKPLRDAELLVSKAQKFALGFFSPGKSTKRYVGIWYNNLPEQTIVWVANRDQPVNDTSGILSINNNGNLVLHHKYSTFPIWSTKVSSPSLSNTTVIAQLSDIANLVLIQNNTKTLIWQSFDHPTDTFLPYSKLGFDRRTGHRWYVQSWKSEDDPGSGNLILNLTSTGKPQMFLFKENHQWWRGGSYNGEIFVGAPSMKRSVISLFNHTFVDDENDVYLMYNTYGESVIARLMVHPSGFFQTFTWDSQKNQWRRYWSSPESQCDNYGTCGANSNCDPLNYENHQCSCLPGFEPRNPNDWYQNIEMSEGCVKKNENSICGNGEGFVKVEGVKIPDTSIAIDKKGLSLEECEKECLQNCSCMAYAAADVRNGGSGCLWWYGALMDTQKLSQEGHDLYVRVDAIELEKYATKSKGKPAKKGLIAIPIVVLAAILMLIICFSNWKRKQKDMTIHSNQDSPTAEGNGENRMHPNLLYFDIKTIAAATNNFARENELGQGGFGLVYKGKLVDGQEIAIKRLSKGSRQGTQEFKNEVELIAKLQHRNLVRLLGCCIHKEERILIYEYLPNKSLDFFLFDITRRSLLDWSKRFEIIFGIARGVLYLHQDSRLKIIHRDLKASNVLLDARMNPKISDFGMAKIFKEDQIQARTRRVVGTFGYMSPEYVTEGHYSTKSDVFSFGVLLLEIISGKRSTDRERGRRSINLIGHVWDLWREQKALDMVDLTLGQSFPPAVVLRCIHIGLLCVQESHMNRPSMWNVVFMLGNETTLPPPKKPAFILSHDQDYPEPLGASSVNEITCTTMYAR